MKLHVISNGKMPVDQFLEVATAIEDEVDCIHVREKQLPARKLYEFVKRLIDGGIQPDKLIIHERVDVALALSGCGVQLTTHSLPINAVKRINSALTIGCSTHTLDEVKKAEANNASFAIFGHIFPTQSKPGLEPRGCGMLKKICENIMIPVIAIGGITPENTGLVIQSGASGIAVMSGILEEKDPVHACKVYKQAMKSGKEGPYEKTV